MNLLEKAVNLASTASEHSFQEQLPGPFLVYEKPVKDSGLEASFQTSVRLPSVSKTETRPFATNNERHQITDIITSLAALQQYYILFSVEKTQRNTFSQGITIGRTNNNDIPLPDGSVSKFHAWIQRPTPPSSEYRIFDAQSRYGTYVGGVSAPAQGALLRPHSIIRLGSSISIFMPSSLLYNWLREKLLK